MRSENGERILVSLPVGEEAELRHRLGWLQGKVGWVELRLDRWQESLDLAPLIADFPRLQFVAAILLEEEGGGFGGTEEQRRRRLQSVADTGFAVVDLPLGSGAVELPAGVRRLVSWHQPRAGAVDLEQKLQAARLEAGDDGLVKLVPWADSAEQSLPAVELQRQHGPRLLSFAQGPGGSASRILSWLAGSPWIYSCWPGAQTAPGQWDVRQLLKLLPPSAGPQTQVMGIVGRSVEHSLSPWLWNTALQRCGQDGVYLRFPVADGHAFFAAAARCGIQALSVTAPWKQVAAEMALQPPPGGAANFLRASADGWIASNTDGAGAMRSLELAGLAPSSRILLLGAGGASRGLTWEAQRRGHAVTVAARRPAQADALLSDLLATSTGDSPSPQSEGDSPSAQSADLARVDLSPFDAVVQATPVGGYEEPLSPTPGRSPRAGALALDMVYAPLQTTWLREAGAAGAVTLPGSDMLLQQMVLQFQDATGIELDSKEWADELLREVEQRAPLVLIGARGSGKSSLGRALADALEWNFLDADEELERQSGRSIREWVDTDASAFRKAERDLLPQLLTRSRHVLALGGGVVESALSVQRLQLAPRVVFLDCTVETLLQRQRAAPRPALTELPLAEEIQLLLQQRRAAYLACADRTWSNDGGVKESVLGLMRSEFPHRSATTRSGE